LSILCSQIGFDPGTLAFDQSKGMKTATEVISENSKTFGTVKAHENGIRDSLIDMVHAIFDLAVRYGLTWDGVPVERLLSGGYNVSVKFDDSIIQNKDAEINQGVMLVGASLMSKKRFMTDTLGLTPEEADAEISQIKSEGRGDTVDVTRLFGRLE
jgi:A118 family predicted phage portal protein